jgi:hypothetical protein
MAFGCGLRPRWVIAGGYMMLAYWFSMANDMARANAAA